MYILPSESMWHDTLTPNFTIQPQPDSSQKSYIVSWNIINFQKRALLGCRYSDWCSSVHGDNQFCYLMFSLLIVKLFEKCVFVLRTELMVWGNGSTQICYIMSTIKNCNTRFLPNSAISFLDRHHLIDLILLFRPIWQKGLDIHDEIGPSGQRIRSPNNYGMNLRHIRTGLYFSEDFWINREAVSDSRTNVKTIN